MHVDLLDQADEAFYQSELVPGNDYPEAAYFEMTPGHYRVYDAGGELITENEMPELDFQT